MALALLVTFMVHPFGHAQVAPSGKFLKLNGIDQFLSIPDHADFNIAVGESYTLACRIKADNFNGVYSILSKGDMLSVESRYELYTRRSDTLPNLALNLFNADHTNLGSPFITTITPGTWFHVAWVFNASDKTSKLFVNGELLHTVINHAIGRRKIDNDSPLLVGCSLSEEGVHGKMQFWPGHIDELRIWKRALSYLQIGTDMRADTANPVGLVAAFDFSTINGRTVTDVSGQGHHGKLFGYEIKVIKTELPVGIGDRNERLTAFRVTTGSSSESIRQVVLELKGTDDLSDIAQIHLYHNGSKERFRPETANLIGTMKPARGKLVFESSIPLEPGENFFWVTADVSDRAKEGQKLGATVLSYTSGEGVLTKLPDVPGTRTILINHRLLFSGGDAGSRHYRIPALVTARDGSLVAVTDKRWNTPFDLPNHIDVVVRRSTDKGQTWSDPVTIAGNETAMGFGDAALVVNRRNGDIVCLFAADRAFFYSNTAAPIRTYQSISRDNGQSWSPPVDITAQIYGNEATDPMTRTWQGAFVTSGAAVQLSSGRLMAVLLVRETFSREISNFIIYSDDNAATWKVLPNRALLHGGEAKIIEINHGHLLMSVRKQGKRTFVVSKDHGMNWSIPFEKDEITDPSCNGDLIRYTSTQQGFQRNRILHSIPLATSRRNVSVLLSYDEGESWPVKKSIYPGPSAYSSMTVLSDGTIGLYYEVGEYEIYQMYFARFSLKWLTDGADVWSDRMASRIISSAESHENGFSFSVYPNPATDRINLSGTFLAGDLIELFNNSGVLVHSIRIEAPCNQATMQPGNLPPGIYLLRSGGTTRQIALLPPN